MKLRLLVKDKRGDVFQLTYLIVLLLVIAIIGLIIGFVSWKITGAFQENAQIQNSTYANQVNTNFHNQTPYIIDGLIFFFFLGGTIGLLVAAVRTNFSIVIIGLFFIMMLISIFIAAEGANIYQGFAQNPTISPFSDTLTFTNILFSKYTPMLITIIGALLMMIMYGKSGGSIGI